MLQDKLIKTSLQFLLLRTTGLVKIDFDQYPIQYYGRIKVYVDYPKAKLK